MLVSSLPTAALVTTASADSSTSHVEHLDIAKFGARANDLRAGAVNRRAFESAIQIAAERGGYISLGAGVYTFDEGFETPHVTTYYHFEKAWGFIGHGAATVLTMHDRRSCDYTSEDTIRAGALIRQHGSNVVLRDFVIQECAVGLYRGQHPKQADPSQITMCRTNNVHVRDCGTGIIDSSAGGNHYNTQTEMHIFQCQIGYHSREGAPGLVGTDYANSNRGTWFATRFARCWIGMLLEHSNGTEIHACYAEGNNVHPEASPPRLAPSGNQYPFPRGILFGGKDLDDRIDSKPCAVYLCGPSIFNELHGFVFESNSWNLYNAAYGTQIFGGLFSEGRNPPRCIFVEQPQNFITNDSFIVRNVLSWSKESIFSPNAGNDESPNILHLKGAIDHQPGIFPAIRIMRADRFPNKSFTIERIVDLENLKAHETRQVLVQSGDQILESTTSWEITIAANGTDGVSCLAGKFVGVTRRHNGEIVQNYIQHLYQIVAPSSSSARAIDAATAATEEYVIMSFVTEKNALAIALRAPNNDLSRLTIEVRQHVAVE